MKYKDLQAKMSTPDEKWAKRIIEEKLWIWNWRITHLLNDSPISIITPTSAFAMHFSNDRPNEGKTWKNTIFFKKSKKFFTEIKKIFTKINTEYEKKKNNLRNFHNSIGDSEYNFIVSVKNHKTNTKYWNFFRIVGNNNLLHLREIMNKAIKLIIPNYSVERNECVAWHKSRMINEIAFEIPFFSFIFGALLYKFLHIHISIDRIDRIKRFMNLHVWKSRKFLMLRLVKYIYDKQRTHRIFDRATKQPTNRPNALQPTSRLHSVSTRCLFYEMQLRLS